MHVLLLPVAVAVPDMAKLPLIQWLVAMVVEQQVPMAFAKLQDVLAMAHRLPQVVLAVSTVVMLQVLLEHLVLVLQVMSMAVILLAVLVAAAGMAAAPVLAVMAGPALAAVVPDLFSQPAMPTANSQAAIILQTHRQFRAVCQSPIPLSVAQQKQVTKETATPVYTP